MQKLLALGEKVKTGSPSTGEGTFLAGCRSRCATGSTGNCIGAALVIPVKIFTEDVGYFLGVVNAFVVVIGKGDDGHILFHEAVKCSAIAVPPAIVVDEFFSILQNKHSPSEAIIINARLFKTVRCV